MWSLSKSSSFQRRYPTRHSFVKSSRYFLAPYSRLLEGFFAWSAELSSMQFLNDLRHILFWREWSFFCRLAAYEKRQTLPSSFCCVKNPKNSAELLFSKDQTDSTADEEQSSRKCSSCASSLFHCFMFAEQILHRKVRSRQQLGEDKDTSQSSVLFWMLFVWDQDISILLRAWIVSSNGWSGALSKSLLPLLFINSSGIHSHLAQKETAEYGLSISSIQMQYSWKLGRIARNLRVNLRY